MYTALARKVRAESRVPRLQTLPPSVDRMDTSLRQTWATEIFIHSQAELAARASVLSCACVWATVQSYYAIYHAAQALMQVANWLTDPPDSHLGTLRTLAEMVERRQVFVAPFNSFCGGNLTEYEYGGFLAGTVPARGVVVTEPYFADCPERLATALKTTRERRHSEELDRWKNSRENRKPSGGKYERIPSRIKRQVCRNTPATTIFDFFYRFRIRSNYRDVDAFLYGPSSITEAVAFHEALSTTLQAAIFSFEVAIARLVGPDRLGQAATNFLRAVGQDGEVTVGQRANLWQYAC